jgi:hypothetical protein
VFVNPAKTFQTWGLVAQRMQVLLFAKLTKENQQEFLDAYDKEKELVTP